MLQLQRHKRPLCAPPHMFECQNLAALEAHPLAGQEARTCPSPVAGTLSLLGTSPTPPHREENLVQPGASAWANRHVSYLLLPLKLEAIGAVTCLIVRFGLFVFLVLVADWCYKGNQRASLRQHSADTVFSFRTFKTEIV